VTPSESVAEAARQRAGFHRKKSWLSECDRCSERWEHKTNRIENSGEFRIGFLGRLDPVKRIGDLVQAMTFLWRRAPAYFRRRRRTRPYRELIDQLDLQSRVFLHGPSRNPGEALAQMDLLVLPSQARGFRCTNREAMAAGVPIVATDAPGIRDVIRNGETGVLVPIGAPAQLAAAIGR